MLTGRQFYLLRTVDRKITREKLAELLGISYNDIVLYENEKKEIPAEIYCKWIKIVTRAESSI
jgi:transcriptional regulator with XRE-family HTH domain